MTRHLVLALALALTACTGAAPEAAPAPAAASDPMAGLVRWRDQGIRDYTVDLTVSCMCRHRGTYTLTVDDGRLLAAVGASGESAGDDVAQLLPTVDGLYRQIAGAMLSGSPVRVELDPTLSYPRDVVLGTPENDAGVVYTLRDLRPATR
jgi:hypothetical protein